jgi:hypothetical protein
VSALLRVTFDPTTRIEPLTVKDFGDLPETVARYLHRLKHAAVRVDYAETFLTGAAFAGGRLLATFDVSEIGGVR